MPNDESEAAKNDGVVDGPRDVAALVEVRRNVTHDKTQVGAPQQEGRLTCGRRVTGVVRHTAADDRRRTAAVIHRAQDDRGRTAAVIHTAADGRRRTAAENGIAKEQGDYL